MVRAKLDIPKLLADLGVPEEVTTAEAAEILSCDRATILRYIHAGLLEYRDTSAPDSSKPNYRIKLDGVMAMRTGYNRNFPERAPAAPTGRMIARRSARPKEYENLVPWA